ncbi:MAG: hypothetical protein GEU28_00700 [Dehalococcoidia bacterium]|nr:hypothetical protein [Dehalococcoidia bacterium]
MYETVVVPLDGSPLAEQALPHAVALARAFDAPLQLVRVFDPMASFAPGAASHAAGVASGSLIEETERVEREECERYLAEQERELADKGLRVLTTAARGPVVPTLVDLIQGIASPIVVLTTRGRGGFKRFVLGSVADSLRHQLEVPVTVIPNTAD